MPAPGTTPAAFRKAEHVRIGLQVLEDAVHDDRGTRHTAGVDIAAHVGASVKDVSSRGRSGSSPDSSWR
jgi:hypothetical protein